MIQPAVIRNISGPLPPPSRLATSVAGQPGQCGEPPEQLVPLPRLHAAELSSATRISGTANHHGVGAPIGVPVSRCGRLSPGPTAAVGGPPASCPSRDGCSTNWIVHGSTSSRPSTTENTNWRPCRRQPRPSSAPDDQGDADQQAQRRREREQHGLADSGEPRGPPTALDDHTTPPGDGVHGSTEQRQHDRRHTRPDPALRDRAVREHSNPYAAAPQARATRSTTNARSNAHADRAASGTAPSRQQVRRTGRAEHHRRERPELRQPGRRRHTGRSGSRGVPERTEALVRRQQQVGPQHAATDQAAGRDERTDRQDDPRDQERPADQLTTPARLVDGDPRRGLRPAGGRDDLLLRLVRPGFADPLGDRAGRSPPGCAAVRAPTGRTVP